VHTNVRIGIPIQSGRLFFTVTDLAPEASQVFTYCPAQAMLNLVLHLVYIPFPFQTLGRPLQLSEKNKQKNAQS